MANWWVTEAGGVPLGPMDEASVRRLVTSGKLRGDGLVCMVGGKQWERVDEVSEFASALAAPKGLDRFDEGAEKTIVDDMPLVLDEEADLSDERTEVGVSKHRA
jgi:hypothetical protein